jgi:hypothetical protein
LVWGADFYPQDNYESGKEAKISPEMKIELCMDKEKAGRFGIAAPPDGNPGGLENWTILFVPVFSLQAGSALLAGFRGMETASGTGTRSSNKTNKRTGNHI